MTDGTKTVARPTFASSVNNLSPSPDTREGQENTPWSSLWLYVLCSACFALLVPDADLEHLGAADRARALRSRLAVLHGHRHRVLHFALLFALNAVRLRVSSPL